MEIILPNILRFGFAFGIILLGIGVWRCKLTPTAFSVVAAAWAGVFILISVPFESASRLVGAGFEIDLRLQQAEDVLERLKLAEQKIANLGAEVEKAEALLVRLESAEKTIVRLDKETKITLNSGRIREINFALISLRSLERRAESLVKRASGNAQSLASLNRVVEKIKKLEDEKSELKRKNRKITDSFFNK